MIRRPPRSTLFPTRRSSDLSPLQQRNANGLEKIRIRAIDLSSWLRTWRRQRSIGKDEVSGSSVAAEDRKSTRLNSSHGYISYAVFCLKKKIKKIKCHVCHRQ